MTSEQPSLAKRGAYFAGGAAVGALIGYGFVSASPAPPSILELGGAIWVLGGAAIVGVLAGIFTDKVFRRRRSFGSARDPD
jgi:hypothetical protein